MKTRTKRMTAALLAVLMLASAAGCNKEATETQGTPTPVDTVAAMATSTETVDHSFAPETAAETELTLPDDAELIEDPVSDIKEWSNETDAPVTEAPETVPAETEAAEPARIYNYLNGYTTTEEERNRRPVAIMMNNIKNSLPQIGICEGDIYYECAAEGGITRIMMLVDRLDDLGTIGSIRSARDYFVDFIANHDAIYVHAGGSGLAYEKIAWRGIENLDGVNMYVPDGFYRDMDRWNTMGMEHSLMTSGEGIQAGIDFKDYRTELDPKQVPLFQFYDEETDNKLVGSPASHVHMQSTAVQTVDFVYNEETGEYLRYQYNGMAHVDGATGEQISVKNVLILFTDISVIPGDEAGRLSVGTVGSGQGYYITNGKRKVVNWSRAGKTTTLELEYRNGDELILNAGKTFICVVDDSVARKIDFEYEW